MSRPNGVAVGDVHLLVGWEDAGSSWLRVIFQWMNALLGGYVSSAGAEKSRPVLRVSRHGEAIASRSFRTSAEANEVRDAIVGDPLTGSDRDWQAILDGF